MRAWHRSLSARGSVRLVSAALRACKLLFKALGFQAAQSFESTGGESMETAFVEDLHLEAASSAASGFVSCKDEQKKAPWSCAAC